MSLFDSLEKDEELYSILQKETDRQRSSLELIASENFTSTAVLEANGTIFTNKYSEGYPSKRYYGGNEHIDELENLCKKRALEAYQLDPNVWDVNVQSYSGSTANFSVYTALLQPNDRLMGLDLPAGGHLTHGYYTANKKISNSSIYFQSLPYKVGNDFLIDYDGLERDAKSFKPKLIIVGASAYCRDYDYDRFRAIANMNQSYLMADIAHTSGLVSAGLLKSPFDHCDVVTTTTHKTLRGPRGALIFYKKEFKDRIDFAVFPSSQGGPHNNTISAIATALHQVNTPAFKEYAKQVVSNAKYFANRLMKYGFDVITGGTDNHIVLVNLKNKGISGARFEKIAELCNMSVNKNTIATDTSAFNPSGIRLGTAAMTTRGFKENDFEFTASMIHRITEVTQLIQQSCTTNKLDEFITASYNFSTTIQALKDEISSYCFPFALPNSPLYSTTPSNPTPYIKDLVSIIIPSYNRYELLTHCIKSCLTQTYSSIEIIVVNDCSTDPRYTDGSLEKFPKTRVVHLPINQREKYNVPAAQGATRQEGLQVAQGEWIAFLDDDDLFLPNKLELQLNYLKTRNGLFCSSNMFQINHKTISLESPQFNIVKTYFQQGEVPSILSKEYIDRTNYINNSTVLLHKSIINKVGPFKPEKYEDWEYWKKVVVHTPCHYMDYALVYYTVSVENRSTLKHYIY
jgi:glycine hydroxymethyltransferase